MNLTAIQTPKAPQAIGPYSQAIRCGDLLFASGQIPLDPATGELVEGDIDTQTKRVMENLRAVLDAAGTDFSAVVKSTIYLKDLGHFGRVNEVYGSYFKAPYPARVTIQAGALPRGSLVEIDVIAKVSR